MDISFSNIGARTSTAASIDAGTEVSKAGSKNVLSLKAANEGVSSLDILNSCEPVADIPDAALSRDDELGKLVSHAFNLPPPAMPLFTND
jgi:hypothetical protein